MNYESTYCECGGPSGAQGGCEDLPHPNGPPHACLQVLGGPNTRGKIGRSQGTRGPTPGYLTQGPPTPITPNPTINLGNTQMSLHHNQGSRENGGNEREMEQGAQPAHEQPVTQSGPPNTESDTIFSGGDPAIQHPNSYPPTSYISTPSARALRGCRNRRRTPIEIDNAPRKLAQLRESQHNSLGTPANKSKKPRAHLLIASINIKGRGASDVTYPEHKWNAIYRVMLKRKMAILAVHETHLSEDHLADLPDSYIDKKLKVFNTINRDRPNAAGTAIVLNDDLIHTDPVRATTLIHGRAICIETHWKGGKTLTVLSLYAPNDTMQNNMNFWHELTRQFLTLDIPTPDIVLTEDTADRSNGKPDHGGAIAALHKFKTILKMRDGWRDTFPTRREFSHLHVAASGETTASRIDRIYVNEDLLPFCHEWRIEDDFGGVTDHRMVSMVLNSPELPELGKGRPTMHQSSIESTYFMQKAMDESVKLLTPLLNFNEATRTESQNVQTVLKR
ncbi:hypothetical protein PQX77_016024 [Marasmius sp. AFHP31]|nr:hypothetical protein PQX77_016024 [Marasmius sp. AFHP31]